jgi:uncharacterized repeat protein (TIGR01451 family)
MREARAVGTDAGVQITNQATVNYTVGGVAQVPVQAQAQFVVDRRIDLTVVEVGGAATTPVSPNQTNQPTTFTVQNTGNSTQELAVAGTNRPNGEVLFTRTDNSDVNNLRVYLDDGDGVFDAGDTLVTFVSLLEDQTITVHVIADIPPAATNGQVANVRLNAQATVAGTNGGTPETQSAGADQPNVVDIVFADGNAGGNVARDGQGFADDQYVVVAAAFTATKAATVVSDPLNNTTNPKAIPGATVEYAITLANAAGAGAGVTGLAFNDPIQADTTFVANAYGAGQDISLTLNAGAATFCTAAADADGCTVAGNVLTVQAPALPDPLNAGDTMIVRFRVTIN